MRVKKAANVHSKHPPRSLKSQLNQACLNIYRQHEVFVKTAPDESHQWFSMIFPFCDPDIKLKILKIYEAYGSNSLMAYDTFQTAACDPEPLIHDYAISIMGKDRVESNRCSSDVATCVTPPS